jgi:hypothetical protein
MPVRAIVALVILLAPAGCAGGTATLPAPTPPHPDGPLAFGRRPGWQVATTGIGTQPPQAPTAWATTLRVRGAVAADPLDTVIPRLRAHPAGIAIVVTIYGRARRASAGLRRVFPPRRLPLRLRDAAVQHRWEGMPSPGIVLETLTALVHGYLVQVDSYFGTQHPPPGRIAAAQRALSSLAIPAGS